MSTPVSPRRRVKKRILIPVILLGLVLILFLGLYLRGTWTDSVAHDPQTPTEGTQTQLYRTPQGEVQIRCAMLLDAPASKVWAVIRDYPSHPNFMPYISAVQAQPQEGNRVFLTGTAHSRVWGDWPFSVSPFNMDLFI